MISGCAGTKMLPAMGVPRLVDRLARTTRDVKIGAVPIFGEVRL